MESLLRDLKFGLRVVRKRPVVTVAGVLCLALGIGAATVVFSLVSSVLLDPLPIKDSEEVVYIYTEFRNQGVVNGLVSGKEYSDFVESSRAFESVEALTPWYFNITQGDQAERRVGAQISPGLFPMLGVSPRMGRNFTVEEAEQKAAVVIISHELWQRSFGGDPEILEQTISLEGTPYDIVGVMPPGFFFRLETAAVWVPWRANLQWPRHIRFAVGVARLTPGTSLQTAQQDLDAIAQRMQQDHAAAYPADSGWGLKAVEVRQDLLGDVQAQLVILMGAVLLVLFIACMNVANLLLVQAAKREREIGMRAAVGARPWDLVRQLLVESLILALLGCFLGLVLAFWGIRAVLAWGLDIPRIQGATIDLPVLFFALGVSLVTGILFGLVPALRATKVDLYEVLREGARAGESGAKQALRKALVVGEITLAVLVLIGAGLMIRSFETFDAADPGFNTENVVTSELFLSPKRFRSGDDRRALYNSLLNELANRPEIQQAAVTTLLPLEVLDEGGTLAVEGRESTPGNPDPSASWRMISPEFFQVMDIPLMQGREFTNLDHQDNQPVVILDANLAARLFPENPIGRRIRLEKDPMQSQGDGWRTVVGVVGNVRDKSLVGEDNPLLYVPYPQYPYTIMTVLAETSLDTGQVRNIMQETLRKIDPSQPVAVVQTTGDLLEKAKASARFNRFLFSLFGIAVLLLVAVGVYGVMAYTVAQRTQEIGLRMALGAAPNKVLALVLRQGLTLGLVGLLAGLGLSLLMSIPLEGFFGSLLHGVSMLDPLTFIGVFAVLTTLVLLGTFVPAFRATRIDPLRALRDE